MIKPWSKIQEEHDCFPPLVSSLPQSLIREQRTATFVVNGHHPSVSSGEALCKLGPLLLVGNLKLILKMHIPFGPDLHIRVFTWENIVSLWRYMQWQKFINILIVCQEGKVWIGIRCNCNMGLYILKFKISISVCTEMNYINFTLSHNNKLKNSF